MINDQYRRVIALFLLTFIFYSEPNHNTSLSAATANPPHPKTCKVTEWQCANKVQCILISNVCNGRLNCADGSDETFGCDLDITDTGCKSWGQVTHVRCVTRPDEGICTLPEYKNSTCRKCNGKGNKWRCDDGQCIDEAKRFNGYPDCIDASDEFVGNEYVRLAFKTSKILKNCRSYTLYLDLCCVFMPFHIDNSIDGHFHWQGTKSLETLFKLKLNDLFLEKMPRL